MLQEKDSVFYKFATLCNKCFNFTRFFLWLLMFSSIEKILLFLALILPLTLANGESKTVDWIIVFPNFYRKTREHRQKAFVILRGGSPIFQVQVSVDFSQFTVKNKIGLPKKVSLFAFGTPCNKFNKVVLESVPGKAKYGNQCKKR